MATYYVRADGTATSKTTAIGPETDATACMTPAVQNTQTYIAGDVVMVSDEGGIIYNADITELANAIYSNPDTSSQFMMNTPMQQMAHQAYFNSQRFV